MEDILLTLDALADSLAELDAAIADRDQELAELKPHLLDMHLYHLCSWENI